MSSSTSYSSFYSPKQRENNASICSQSPALRAAHRGLRRLAGGGAEGGAEAALAGCAQLQSVTQLVLGFLLPCLWLYCSEARQRRAFLQRRGLLCGRERSGLDFVRLALPALTPWALLTLGQGARLPA